MRAIQFIGLIILFSTLFLDWGGFGRSLYERAFVSGIEEDLIAGVLVVGVFFCTAFFVLINNSSRSYQILRLVVSIIFLIFVSLSAFFGYEFSNFATGQDKSFDDGPSLASLALFILVITFFIDFRKNKLESQRN